VRHIAYADGANDDALSALAGMNLVAKIANPVANLFDLLFGRMSLQGDHHNLSQLLRSKNLSGKNKSGPTLFEWAA
jgi:hypothetical protein